MQNWRSGMDLLQPNLLLADAVKALIPSSGSRLSAGDSIPFPTANFASGSRRRPQSRTVVLLWRRRIRFLRLFCVAQKYSEKAWIPSFLGFPLNIQSLNSVTKRDVHGAGASPDELLVQRDLQEWDLASCIADEKIPVRQDFDARKPADAHLGFSALANCVMAFRTSGRASPNLLSKYRSTPSGSIGLDWTTARTPSSVFMAGNARPRSSTRNSSPRSCSSTFLSSFGVGLKMPNRLPLLCVVNPAMAFPSDNASSCLNPNRSATTEAQRVNTGARLIRILVDRKSTRLNSSHLGISYAV